MEWSIQEVRGMMCLKMKSGESRLDVSERRNGRRQVHSNGRRITERLKNDTTEESKAACYMACWRGLDHSKKDEWEETRITPASAVPAKLRRTGGTGTPQFIFGVSLSFPSGFNQALGEEEKNGPVTNVQLCGVHELTFQALFGGSHGSSEEEMNPIKWKSMKYL